MNAFASHAKCVKCLSNLAENSFKMRHGKSYKKLISIPPMICRIILCAHKHSHVLVHQAP